MRLLATILLPGLLLTVSVFPGQATPVSLQPLPVASFHSPAVHKVIVRGNGQPRHRGSGRLESYQSLERSLA